MFSKHLLGDIIPFSPNLYVHDKWIGCNSFYHNKVVYYDKPLIKYGKYDKQGDYSKESYTFDEAL